MNLKYFFISLYSAILLSILNLPANAMGFIITDTTHPIAATCAVPMRCSCLKEGCSSAINILWLFEFGDAGIDTATRCGCIQQIHYVDKQETSFLFLFKKTTTHVYGE